MNIKKLKIAIFAVIAAAVVVRLVSLGVIWKTLRGHIITCSRPASEVFSEFRQCRKQAREEYFEYIPGEFLIKFKNGKVNSITKSLNIEYERSLIGKAFKNSRRLDRIPKDIKSRLQAITLKPCRDWYWLQNEQYNRHRRRMLKTVLIGGRDSPEKNLCFLPVSKEMDVFLAVTDRYANAPEKHTAVISGDKMKAEPLPDRSAGKFVFPERLKVKRRRPESAWDIITQDKTALASFAPGIKYSIQDNIRGAGFGGAFASGYAQDSASRTMQAAGGDDNVKRSKPSRVRVNYRPQKIRRLKADTQISGKAKINPQKLLFENYNLRLLSGYAGLKKSFALPFDSSQSYCLSLDKRYPFLEVNKRFSDQSKDIESPDTRSSEQIILSEQRALSERSEQYSGINQTSDVVLIKKEQAQKTAVPDFGRFEESSPPPAAPVYSYESPGRGNGKTATPSVLAAVEQAQNKNGVPAYQDLTAGLSDARQIALISSVPKELFITSGNAGGSIPFPAEDPGSFLPVEGGAMAVVAEGNVGVVLRSDTPLGPEKKEYIEKYSAGHKNKDFPGRPQGEKEYLTTKSASDDRIEEEKFPAAKPDAAALEASSSEVSVNLAKRRGVNTFVTAFKITNNSDVIVAWQLHNNQDAMHIPAGGIPKAVPVSGFGFYKPFGGIKPGQTVPVKAYVDDTTPEGLYEGSYTLQEVRSIGNLDICRINYSLSVAAINEDTDSGLIASSFDVTVNLSRDSKREGATEVAFRVINNGDKGSSWQLINNQDARYTSLPNGAFRPVPAEGFGFLNTSGAVKAGEKTVVRAYVKGGRPDGIYQGSYVLREVLNNKPADIGTVHYLIKVKSGKLPFIQFIRPKEAVPEGTMRIYGRYFGDDNEAGTVEFFKSGRYTQAKIIRWKKWNIVCKVPELSPGEYAIRVVSQNQKSNAESFKILDVRPQK